MLTETIELHEGRSDVTLTTYVLADSPELLDGKPRPAVLICPGGAYLMCSDREAEPVALRFAAMGYHAFVLRYSTYYAGEEQPFPPPAELDVDPRCVHPTPIRDIATAMLTIRTNADSWLIDVDRIAICGFSAGAHNCAMYSVSWDRPVIVDHFGEPAERFRPAAAVLGYGIGDYHLMMGGLGDPVAATISNAARIALLGTPTPTDDQLDEVSPYLHVSDRTPPTFLWATGADSLVPVTNTTRLAEALALAGVPFEAHVFERGPHGLALAHQSSAASMFDIDRTAAQWVDLAQTWLEHRFALPLPERPPWFALIPPGHRPDGT